MNVLHHLDNKLQYEFYLNILRKKKRFAKWAKAENSNDLEMVQNFYNYSITKAKIALSILSEEQLNIIRDKCTRGIDND